MAPRDRRRKRRRQWLPTVLVLVAVALVLFLVIGGALKTGPASRPYWRSVDRSYALQSAVLTRQSNAVATSYRTEVQAFPAQTRQELRQQMDALVQTTGSLAQQAASLSPPGTETGAERDFAQAMAERASAAATLQAAIYGLLDMRPNPIAGAAPGAVLSVQSAADTVPGTGSGSGGATGTQSLADAQAQAAAAGRSLAAGDRAYGAYRTAIRRSIGHPTVPASVWAGRGITTPTFAQDLLQAVSTAPSLVPQHDVVLAGSGTSTAIRVLPAPVPTVVPPGTAQPAAGSQATVPPTRHLSVSATVSNLGNVDEHGVPVTATLTPEGAAAPSASARRAISVVAGQSVAVHFPALHVTPGTTYTLAVAVVPPAGQPAGTPGLLAEYAITVAAAGG